MASLRKPNRKCRFQVATGGPFSACHFQTLSGGRLKGRRDRRVFHRIQAQSYRFFAVKGRYIVTDCGRMPVPLGTEPRPGPGPWGEVTKVQHYYLKVDSITSVSQCGAGIFRKFHRREETSK